MFNYRDKNYVTQNIDLALYLGKLKIVYNLFLR